MHTVRHLPHRTAEAEEALSAELEASEHDALAELVGTVRTAQAEDRQEGLESLVHPLALRRERTRLAHRLGAMAAGRFWSEVVAEVEAVRVVHEGLAEAYERVHHRPSGVAMRFVGVAERRQGRWRLTHTADAVDERLTAVLLRGAPATGGFELERWNAGWTERYGATARLSGEDGRGRLHHPIEGWTAQVRSGTGRELARTLGAVDSAAALLEKQPSATVVSLVPTLDAGARTEQLRWVSRAVALLGAQDASGVWVPSAAKVVPMSTWTSTSEGALDLTNLSSLWLRTQRQRGAWLTRGMSALMLPEVEIFCAGLSVATVRSLMREAVGRLLAHHRARIDHGLGASAPAVPGVAPRLYRRGVSGPEPLELERLASALDAGDCFVVGPIEATITAGRQGPRPGESYGRWGAIALRAEPAWWAEPA